jgi:hypothetical protein
MKINLLIQEYRFEFGESTRKHDDIISLGWETGLNNISERTKALSLAPPSQTTQANALTEMQKICSQRKIS